MKGKDFDNAITKIMTIKDVIKRGDTLQLAHRQGCCVDQLAGTEV